jgi:hypothetical protein
MGAYAVAAGVDCGRCAAPQLPNSVLFDYNTTVHKHLRRLERIWVDAPIYFVTTCTRNRRRVLARDDFARILIAEWHAARLVDTLSCRITFIFSVAQNAMQRVCLILWGLGKVTRAARSMTWVGRGQRPRLQRCGNANFSITFCGRMKVTRKSGIISETILFALVWFLRQTIGHTPPKLRR